MPPWPHKKVRKHFFTGDDWPLFSALLCTIKVLLCQAISMKTNETSNKYLKLILSNCLKLLLFKVYLLTGIPNNIHLTIDSN